MNFAYIFTTWMEKKILDSRGVEKFHSSVFLFPLKSAFCFMYFCGCFSDMFMALDFSWTHTRLPWSIAIKWASMARWTSGPGIVDFLSIRYGHWLMDDSIETTLVIECAAPQKVLFISKLEESTLSRLIFYLCCTLLACLESLFLRSVFQLFHWFWQDQDSA